MSYPMTAAPAQIAPGTMPPGTMPLSTMPLGTMPPGIMPAGMIPPGMMSPVAEEAVRQRCAAGLQRAYRWLEEALPKAPALSDVVPVMITAVQLYQARQYTACLDEVNAVIAGLQQARWAFPTLPPL